MYELFYAALPLYPCFEDRRGVLFVRGFNGGAFMKIGELELPIQLFIYDPQTRVIFADRDGAAVEVRPTLRGLQNFLADALDDIAIPQERLRTSVLSWAIVAHVLNMSLTDYVFRQWIKEYGSRWFSFREAVMRLSYEIFHTKESLQRRVN